MFFFFKNRIIMDLMRFSSFTCVYYVNGRLKALWTTMDKMYLQIAMNCI